MGNIAASYHRSHISPETDRRIFTVIGCIGLLCCFTVAVEMCEKLAGSKTDNWSVIRFMGPQVWLPLKTKEDTNIAIIILVFSVMYAASCGLLIHGGRQRMKDLSLTWKLAESGVLIYQIVAAIITAKVFTVGDVVLLIVDTVLGILALIYTRVAENAWQEEVSRQDGQRNGDSPTPSDDVVPGPSGMSSQEARRSLEGVAGPSGVSLPSKPAGEHPMQEIKDEDSDSLESVTAAVIEQPPPSPPQPRPTSTPRRKKSSLARVAQVTVHIPPPDVKQLDVDVDADRSLTSIPEESSSDQSHSSPTSPHRTSPSQPTAAEKSEALPKDVPHARSASPTEPPPSEEASEAEVHGSHEATEEQRTEAQLEVSDCPPPSAEASQAEPETPEQTEPSTELSVPPDASEPSQPKPSSAAEPSAASVKAQEEKESATGSTASPLAPAKDPAGHETQTEADASQVGSSADTGTSAAETTKPGTEGSPEGIVTTAQQTTKDAEITAEVKGSSDM